MARTKSLIAIYHLHPKSIFIFISLLMLFSCNEKNEYVDALKFEHINSGFTGSKSCMECHKDQYGSWENSDHAQAMKIADSSSVLGNFNNVTFTDKNVKSTFFKKGNDFFVNTEGPDGKYYDYKIEYTFGFDPLQQYIVKFPDGAYQCLLTAWDSVEQKWFFLQPDLDIKHDEWLHWSKGSMRWNTMCADCHSTNLHKNFNSETNTYNTKYSEINVSCEACHGPGEAHVKFYKSNSKGLPPKMYIGDTLNPKELVDKCARCHSRRSEITKVFDYEGIFYDHYFPNLLIDPFYELDGQIKDEDYVYGSFLQSKMYHYGVSCNNCHDVHSLKLKKEGNALCLSCHLPKYDLPSHHFHEMNTEGAQCINCHMQGKFYMVNDFRRDHSFRVPRPDQTVKYNVPNECNTCHKDKDAKWASDFIISKYGKNRADHFSDHLLKGYFENIEGFYEVFSNTAYPNIARATALNQYSNALLTEEEINKIVLFLKDSSDLVRNEVVRSLDKIGATQLSKSVMPLLKDPVRSVRISAARYMNRVGLRPNDNMDFSKANKEYLENMDLNADFAAGQHEIALYNQALGNTDLAIESYQKAIEIDNYHNMSRMNLALLYYEKGLLDESEKLYLKVIEQEPDYGYSYYLLGLLYNEKGDRAKALRYLGLASEKELLNVNAFYNYAILLQQLKRFEESLETIDKGLRVFPNNERLLYGKLLAEINLKKLDEAKVTCLMLIRLDMNNPNYRQILDNLNQTILIN